jgi:hypothetical protein
MQLDGVADVPIADLLTGAGLILAVGSIAIPPRPDAITRPARA